MDHDAWVLQVHPNGWLYYAVQEGGTNPDTRIQSSITSIRYLIKSGSIDVPDTTESDIEDLSKGDVISKTPAAPTDIVVCCAMYFPVGNQPSSHRGSPRYSDCQSYIAIGRYQSLCSLTFISFDDTVFRIGKCRSETP